MSGPRLTPLAESLPATVPFVGPETQERAAGRAFRARLGANELTFGPSPRAIAAMADAARDAWMYPDPECHDLKHALAAHHGIDPHHIVIGSGIDGLLGSTVRLTVGPGDAVVTSDGAYPTFNYHVTGFGGRLHKVPYREDREDLDALIETAYAVDAKLIYLSNPDNPMGSWFSPEEIEHFIGRIPDGTLLLLDEAYAECADIATAPPLVPDHPNVLRLRTFSKAYGMAGARVGYAIGAGPLIAAYDKVRDHFGVSRISQAGAIAALADTEHLKLTVNNIAQSVEAISEIGHRNGLIPLRTATNFVTLDCGRDGDHARALLVELGRRGIFVRMPGVAPLDRCIRVTCGPAPAMEILAEALPDALRAIL
ncbi:pyridoxal phosphate-dependent aminotransferase [Palleronia sp. LCG004]|uniref:pyridoxal phosphate-dependent aminotransferase n=1 Tax=Palleronia sp. LCG004 TaxID=3079304 RepID=UPI002942CEF4|nr:pyridoxal phosphate-dependent aminotransferase [Palleronia sp. LCG004]WOI55148.1 pyridoxal phosphate-dependent aminotransferase [Palleronia sp. LCG004]